MPTAPAPLPPLATADHLLHYPGGPYDSRAIAIAASIVRGECGWHISPVVDEQLLVDHRGGDSIVLPTLRVTDVGQVVHRPTGAVLTGWDFSTAGVLTRPGGWPVGLRALRVSLRHGHGEIPPELLGLVAELAAAWRTGTPGVRAESRTVGGISTARTYTDTGPMGAVLGGFEHVLDRYRVRVPT